LSDPNLPIPQFPTVEPTSVLTFGDLLTDVAYKIGCAYYGADGQGAPQIPIDAHDLSLCKRIVNHAIRKFINDGPRPNGWRWLNPIAQVDLWPQIAYDTTGQTYVTMAYNSSGPYIGTTTLTLVTPQNPPQPTVPTNWMPQFFQSMEMRQVYLNGNPPSNTPGWFLPVDETFGLPPATIGVGYTDTTHQTVVLTGANSGTFTLTFGANTTGQLSATAGASAVQTALNALASLTGNPGPVTVSSATVGNVLTYTITFTDATSTHITANGDNLSPLVIGTPFTILFWLSPTQVIIDGNATTLGFPTNCPLSFAQGGDYTLPATFQGQYTGEITYVANTNRGMILQWISEFGIRSRRQNYNVESGTPYWCAVRIMPTPSYGLLTNTSNLMIPRRRWELMTWRIASEFLSVIFPYTLHFNDLLNNTDLTPAPFSYDEAIKACCLAVAEKEVGDMTDGPDWSYYHSTALPAAWQIDSRSAPRAIGYVGNANAQYYVDSSLGSAIKDFRTQWYQRPTVTLT
jgi:hypothetical protein